MVKEFITKDSGKRQDYDSGMRRDLQEGKPRFDLMEAEDMPYEERLLTRWAKLMGRGADKYGERNWELSNSEEELKRFKSSLYRHTMQFLAGNTDEDHAAAIQFNLNAVITLQYRLKKK